MKKKLGKNGFIKRLNSSKAGGQFYLPLCGFSKNLTEGGGLGF